MFNVEQSIGFLSGSNISRGILHVFNPLTCRLMNAFFAPWDRQIRDTPELLDQNYENVVDILC
jgi:hypothetical protein